MSQTEPEITEGLVRELLQDQHPDLAGLPLSEVEGGWGNQMWRLGDELAVRIQRMSDLRSQTISMPRPPSTKLGRTTRG